ncbi:MAG: RDD family protein [Dehalococcoidia bacterium]|nr:RDD family protein [Dehalococcoidia bacterium]
MQEKPKDYALEYAGFWIRLAAALIDFLILIAGLYILYCVISQSFFWIFPNVPGVIATFGSIAAGAPLSTGAIWLSATLLLALLVANTIYFVACAAASGQTVGKLSLGIKIIRTDSSPLDLRYSFIRFLGGMLCVATLGIGFIVIAFDSHKQGMHDKMADTYVVKLPVKQVVYNQSLARGGIR